MENKTDLRVYKTHKALCDAFLELLCEKKFENITVNELCERAMVRRATFYKHFADKYDFFAFFIREKHSSLISDALKSQNSVSPQEYHIFLFKECIKFFKEHKKLLDGIFNSNMLPTLIDIFTDEIYRNILLKLKEENEKNGKLPASPELLAFFYSGGIVQLLRYWYINQGNYAEDKLIEETEKVLKYFKIP